MSAVRWDGLDPATRASIDAQPVDARRLTQRTCGCDAQLDRRVWLCAYHQGYDDAAVVVSRDLLDRLRASETGDTRTAAPMSIRCPPCGACAAERHGTTRSPA